MKEKSWTPDGCTKNKKVPLKDSISDFPSAKCFLFVLEKMRPSQKEAIFV